MFKQKASITKVLILLLSLNGLFIKTAQSQSSTDSIQIRRMFDLALENGKAYENLRTLCKNVGCRISGSKAADSAVNWGYNVMKSMLADTVYKIPIMVPQWVRGDIEKAFIVGDKSKLDITALGGSIGTNGLLKAKVIIANGIEDLDRLGESKIKGNIVLFNKAFDPKIISGFTLIAPKLLGCVF